MPMMTGAQVMADMLQGYGVSHVFKVPAVLRRTMVELELRTEIRRLHVHAEKSAAYMADGYARASGRPGVCMAQVIGALNLAAGLRDAFLAHSPVIALTGGRDPHTKFRGVYQEVDDLPAFEPVTNFNATVDAVERFPDMVVYFQPSDIITQILNFGVIAQIDVQVSGRNIAKDLEVARRIEARLKETAGLVDVHLHQNVTGDMAVVAWRLNQDDFDSLDYHRQTLSPSPQPPCVGFFCPTEP